MHKDNFGREINLGDVVVSLRSSSNYVPRLLVLKMTPQKVSTSGGALDPNTLLVVTSIMKEQEPAAFDKLMADHGHHIAATKVIAPAKTTTRYAVVELYSVDAPSRYTKDAGHIGILQWSGSNAAEFAASKAAAAESLHSQGYTFGYYELTEGNPSSSSYSSLRKDWHWSYSGAYSTKPISLAKLKALGLDGMVVNSPIQVSLYNITVQTPTAAYNERNFT